MPSSRVPTRTPLVHLPGHFYFADLRATNFQVAQSFYGPLFGWNFLDVSGNVEGQEYRIARIAERDTAGIGLVRPEDAVPAPHWRAYLTVTDISEALARAVLLGARVLEPLVRIPGDGAHVTIQDPCGAVVTLWQYAPGNASITVKDDIGALCWAELHTPDVATAERFYTDLVGWTYDEGTTYSEYRVAIPPRTDERQREAAVLAPYREESLATGEGSHWRVYFHVHDVDATAAKAARLGGSVLVAPTDRGCYGRTAILADPCGATFVVMRPLLPA